MTSVITKVELPRAVARAVPAVALEDRLVAVDRLLESIHIIPLGADVTAAAATLPPSLLRSLDAIHLASARAARMHGRAVVLCGYDRRLQGAAVEHGLLAISPG